MNVRLLIQLADRGGRYLVAPQCLRNVFYAPNRYACQIHLNDSGFKRESFEPGHPEGDIPGCGGEVTIVVAATIALPLVVTLVPVASLPRLPATG